MEGEICYALTGGLTPARPKGRPSDARDTAYLFRSTDLEHWEYLHPFYEGGVFTDAGEDCAVPQFFPLGDRYALLFASHLRGPSCYLGTYAGHRFVPESVTRFSWSPSLSRVGTFCEGLTLLDGRNRRILFGRMSEGRFGYVQRAAGWSGISCLTMLIEAAPDGGLLVEPVPELRILRDRRFDHPGLNLQNECRTLHGLQGDGLEIDADFVWDDAEEFGLKVLRSPEGEEETLVRFVANPGQRHPAQAERIVRRAETGLTVAPVRELFIDPARSSLSAEVANRECQSRPVPAMPGDTVKLRVFVDRSVVEVFCQGRHYLGKRVYPSRDDSLGVAVYAIGGSARLVGLTAWTLSSIWD